MSTDADYTDAHRLPSIPPPPPHRPGAALPDEDPQTTVLRPVPADPSVPPPAAPPGPAASRPVPPAPAAPPRPAAPPPVPPRPRTPPPAAGPPAPPRPDRAPAAPPAAAPPPAPGSRPDSFRDTAAFHLANSQELWSGGRDGAPGARPGRTRAAATPSAAPGSTPPAPGAARPSGAPWTRTPLRHPGVAPVPGMPTVPRSRPAVRRPGGRLIATAACLVLGVGLIGGAAAGSWLSEDERAKPTAAASFTKGHDAWHSTPVNTLFPRHLDGLGVGPGGSDRSWTRIAVAPDSNCSDAYDPKLARALARVGCARLLRATYVDATRTDVITVGAQVAKGDQNAMMALNTRFSTDSLGARTDLMPLPYAAGNTPAADFGPKQRASWTVRILTDIPVVIFAVSGFADGRVVTDPQPAEAAVREGATTAPAESGLGHSAKDLADLLEVSFRKASGIPTQATEASP